MSHNMSIVDGYTNMTGAGGTARADSRRSKTSRCLYSILLIMFLACVPTVAAQDPSPEPPYKVIDDHIAAVEKQVIEWRREIHSHPELGNRETHTAALVAEHLRRLGMTVRMDVAHTGVVGLLKGAHPGPVVALRADMDALPVAEQTGLPFASKITTTYNGQETGVMHACGHDAHVSILMGAAQVLADMQGELAGSVKFIFQPAEEGAPPGEEGGAELMVREGVLEDPRPDAIFGLHVFPDFEVGQIAFRAAGALASSDRMRIVVRGRQTHGAKPWMGTDPIVISAQIITALQTIPSRQLDVTLAPAIVTVGRINGGIRYNIIPDEVEMLGTVRAFDDDMRADIHRRIERTAAGIAESAGGAAEVEFSNGTPVTYNDPALTAKMAPTLSRVVGDGNVIEARPQTWAEDFSCYQREIPGLYFILGVRTPGADPSQFAPNHSPKFMIDEDALQVGVRAMVYLAVDYMYAR